MAENDDKQIEAGKNDQVENIKQKEETENKSYDFKKIACSYMKECPVLSDKTNANILAKVTNASLFGLVFSVIWSLKSKKFRSSPILLGAGYGLGQGICEKNFVFNAHKYDHGEEITVNYFKNNNCKGSWRENKYCKKYCSSFFGKTCDKDEKKD